jgi:hypothetical protein
MDAKRERGQLGVFLVGLATLIGIPIFLISIALLEIRLPGSHSIEELYKRAGIYVPLDWLIAPLDRFI